MDLVAGLLILGVALLFVYIALDASRDRDK